MHSYSSQSLDSDQEPKKTDFDSTEHVPLVAAAAAAVGFDDVETADSAASVAAEGVVAADVESVALGVALPVAAGHVATAADAVVGR